MILARQAPGRSTRYFHVKPRDYVDLTPRAWAWPTPAGVGYSALDISEALASLRLSAFVSKIENTKRSTR